MNSDEINKLRKYTVLFVTEVHPTSRTVGEGPEYEHLVSLLQTFHIKVIRHGHNRQINSFIFTIDHIRVMPQDRSF